MKKLIKKIDQALFKGHLSKLYIQLLKYRFLFKTLTLDNKTGFFLDGIYVPYYTKGPNINRPPFSDCIFGKEGKQVITFFKLNRAI
jgi:hypothetical protein